MFNWLLGKTEPPVEKKSPKEQRDDDLTQFFAENKNSEEILVYPHFGINYGANGILMLQEYIETNKKLCKLNIKFVIGAKWMKNIAPSIKQNKSIKILDLSNIHLEKDECYPIAEIIEYNKKITELDLSQNRIADGASIIASSLKKNWRLKKLNVANNLLSKKELSDLFMALLEFDSVTYLDISNVTNHSSIPSLESKLYLKETKNLKTLILEKINISLYDSIQTICDIIENNESLTELSISHNHLTNWTNEIDRVFNSLNLNNKISIFRMDSLNLDGYECVGNFIKTNKSLKKLSCLNCFAYNRLKPPSTGLMDYLEFNFNLVDFKISRNFSDKWEYLLQRNLHFQEITKQFQCINAWKKSQDVNFKFKYYH
eukprot:gene8748-696_t